MHFVLFRDDLSSMKLRRVRVCVYVCAPNTFLSNNDFTVLNKFWQQLGFCTFKNTCLQMIFLKFGRYSKRHQEAQLEGLSQGNIPISRPTPISPHWLKI